MLEENRSFFFDLDKTLWNWDSTIIGAEDLIDTLRESGKDVYFHTDNTLLTRKEYAKKLTSLNIPAEEEDVITSGYVAAEILAEKNVKKVYAMGETGLISELEKKDIEVSSDADKVVAGFDRQFSYSKLKRAMKILETGDLYLCSTENTFRTSHGVQPHQGPMNQALTTFAEPELLGKPGEAFRKVFRNYFDYFAGKSVFIGDRLEDIATGNRLGMDTAAVMSGDIDREKLKKADEDQTPDFGVSSLAKLKRRAI